MKRGHLKKRIGSLLLALAMIVTSFPVLSTEVQAVEAKTSGTGPSVTAFAEKDQLMTVFKPDENGNSDTIGKLAFGKNRESEVQNWYILGKDEGVSGDNTVLFAAGPIETGKMFNSDKSDQTYTPAANTGYTDTSSVTVYANHYGASRLYMELNSMASNYFAGVEQGLMNKTTVKTNDPKNNVDYTTTAKLYALTADGTGSYIKAGSRDQIVLAKEKYWNSGSTFWLRAPYTRGEFVLSAKPNRNGVSNDLVNFTNAVVPAFSLNLSSVLFASAAEASSSEAAVAGTIVDGTAMTLRLDGTGKAIGTVIYDEAAGKIVAQKDANATGTVSLVVQGNDGTNDWYYSVQAGETTVVTEKQIMTACSLSGEIDLADCKIWLETPAENGRVAYATKMAKTKKTIDAVALTGVKPAGGSAFPVKASCGTEGVDANSLAVTYTAKDTSGAATGTAEWNTAYQAGLTLAAVDLGSTVYVFGDPVSVTVDGETAQSVKLNDDGTLTVTKDFTTAKRKITGISAPAVPSSNVFADYYTAENVLSNTNRELGKTATLTLEGNASPNTVNADVAWTLANSGSTAYNAAPGAGNTFRWTIAAEQIKEYDASGCTGYDREAGTISGTVTISNKASTPVTITGDNQTLNFDGSTIDVSKYFTIDTNAGTRSYSLVQDTGVTGEGSLSGAVLTVTKPGVFQVKLTTAANGNYAAGEKTITLTVNYSSGAVTLAPGKTVVHEDETVTNGSDGTVTIDKGNDGTVDVTVKLPQAGTVNIDAEGKVTVPANGTVQATDGKELTLPEGGKVDKDGNVEAAKIVSGDVTVTAPSGGKVTADKAGTITVPAGGTVQTEDGKEITLPAGGSVDKDGNVEAGKIIVGDTTVTLPVKGKVETDNDGNIIIPAGGTVQTGDGKELTLPEGGSVDKDGTVDAGKITVGNTTVTAPSGKKVTVDKDGNITVPAGGKVETEDGKVTTLPDGGTVDKDGNVKTAKITVGNTTVTLPEEGKVETDEAGNITVPAGGTVETGDGEAITLPDGGTVDKDGNVKTAKITVGNTTVTLPEEGKVETDEAGNITIPDGGTVQTGDGKELALPEGGSVDKDGNVEAGKITVGNTTVTAPLGKKVTVDNDGTITVPAGGTVETGDGAAITLPEGGTVDKDGNVESRKITIGDIMVTAPDGEKVTADNDGTITVPAGGKVETGDGKVTTLPEGGTVDKDGNVNAGKITVGNTTVTLPEEGKIETDEAGTITVPAGGTVQTGDGAAITLPDGGTVDKAGTVEGGKITVGETTVTAPEGGKVTADKAGTITVPAGGTVQTGDGVAITLPSGGTVDKAGTIEAEKITVGNTTVTAPEGGKVTADKAGIITVPAEGTVETGDGKELTLPNGGTVDKDENVEAEKITSGETTVTAPEGGKVTADKAGTITVPAGGKVETGDGKELTLPNGGTVDTDGNVEAAKTDAEKVEAAKSTVEEALAGITATNRTTKEEIQSIINTALTKAEISDVTVTVGDFSKTEATTSAAGSISGTVTIKCGTETDSVVINKSIGKLPEDTKQPEATKVPEDTKLPEDSIIIPQQREKNNLAIMAGMKVSQTGKKISISWGKIKEADGYQVYVSYCGKKFTAKPAKTVKSASVTKVSVKKLNGKKLNLKRNYKVYIAAYKIVNGKEEVIGKTLPCHIVGKNNDTYTNAKQIKLTKSKFTLKAGKTAKIKAKVVLVDKKKKPLSNAHAKQFRYATSNKTVATVSKAGKIKAVGKGSCTIYVYARNGYAKKITVKVK